MPVEYFRYQELMGNGKPFGPELWLSYHQLIAQVARSCPQYPQSSLDHMLALMKAAPGHPVDLVCWNQEKTGLIWSARLRLPAAEFALSI